MLVKLPNGLIESGGQELFNYVKIDELRGKQQNYLADQELIIGNIGHIPKILEDLVLSFQTEEGFEWKGKISEAIRKIPSEDIETILIKIREHTYGPRYYFEVVCEECNSKIKNLRLDLDELKMEEMPLEEMLEPKIISLPKMGVDVELAPLVLDDLFKTIKITKNKKKSLVTSFLSLSIKRIGDNTHITENDISKISASDLYHISKSLDKMRLSGHTDTDVEISCSNCGHEFKTKLNPFDPSFFDPTRGSAS